MSINKNGTISENVFSETLSCQYDRKHYVEPDGSVWIRIFHHNNPASTKFASTDSFTTSVYYDNNRWFNVSVCDLISGTWEVMLKQTTTSGAAETKYRWTQKTNPMGGTYNDVSPTSSNIIRNTSSGYTDGGYGGIYKLNSNTYLCIANSNNGNWFGAIGAWGSHNGGIPGYPNTVVTTGYMDLYLRVDNIQANSIARKNKVGFIANNFYEI